MRRAESASLVGGQEGLLDLTLYVAPMTYGTEVDAQWIEQRAKEVGDQIGFDLEITHMAGGKYMMSATERASGARQAVPPALATLGVLAERLQSLEDGSYLLSKASDMEFPEED